jgi:hypothetical protein
MCLNIKSIIICVAIIILFTFLSCTDPVGSSTGSGRYVVEMSEANLTGAGGVVSVPQITVGVSGDGGAAMPNVIVYGNGRGQDNTWREVMDATVISEGQVTIEPNEYPSYYYRVVVIK